MATLQNPGTALKNTAIVVGALLVALTVGSYVLGIDHMLGFSRLALSMVLIIAFVKAWLVTQFFMDIRHSPAWLKVLVDGWVILTGAAVVGMFIWL